MRLKNNKLTRLKPDLTADERVRKCGEMIQQALGEYGCQMFTALKIGNADAPLPEIAGFPIVIKVICAPKA